MKKLNSLCGALLIAFLTAVSVFSQVNPPTPALDVPYVPTSQEVVDAMLKLANVKKATWFMIWAAATGAS